ncbi:NADH-quinone oxidoreductase subunit L [Methylobacterium haplocladii]|uniref:NADH:ubiquinone oxidoreductase subunit L n=1 Tax=Methylobacterium haplocladii TaxID=1176176 RepID=A0A512ISX8_9HYPH|nr:NADH-quinone oxidoreductase subunit L [Methylobacterium haplocladii]GEP00815.1 NADH:ubiquinone oxidoreductase subunit L [Methylobacterium haplocladii]GJD85211.1 NADH-quinone oxidoreductase subunit L [Methylobacterium haplocladii]GLS59291.1 NADH:ubiquinone oxidoreductase subunit L [Methylobacterium haplocladii]
MYHAIVFLPLIGALIAGLFGRFIGARVSEYVTTSCLAFACLIAWGAFFIVTGEGGHAERVQVAQWFSAGDLNVDWAFKIDTLTCVMLVVVTTVSTLVHLYSVGYMEEDPHRPRFFAYLSLFTFAMLMLVTADNLVQMFFGWEGVGLASYLLIGFWYEKPSANAAAMKAFIVNRVGDFGFSLGIFLVFVLTGSVSFDAIFANAPALKDATFHFLGYDWNALTLACLLLFMGAMGKSAQFLLHTWLPDAMEGPTPVSALIHAATMVTAGVFMVARLSPLFELAPVALSVVTIIGGITAFFAATIGLVQNDIKRVIAYSTCSQLGYMFVGLGVGAYATGVFHLFTHAFFKALLFLGAGSVIHAMHHEQDMRNMGNLRRYIPFTTAMMTIGTLALIGFPYTAGYYSKDAIIEAAYMSDRPGHVLAFLATVIAAFMTSFYSWRLFFLTFEGPARWGAAAHHDAHAHHAHEADGKPGHTEGAAHDDHGSNVEPAHKSDVVPDHATGDHGHGHDHTPHESPLVMTIPLAVLAFGALFAGVIFKDRFIGEGMDEFWGHALAHSENHIMHKIHEAPGWVSASPFIMLVAGFVLAFWMYIRRPELPHILAEQQPSLYRFLLNKWYFDELYDRIFVRPAKNFGLFLWKEGDGRIIDGMGPDGISARVVDVTRGVVRLQTGYVYHYAFVMLVGVAGLITWYMITGTAGGAH